MFMLLLKSPRSNQTPSATFSGSFIPRTSLVLPPMPTLWKIGMVVLVACLLASMAIAIVRLTTTPTEILGDGFRGLPAHHGGQATP